MLNQICSLTSLNIENLLIIERSVLDIRDVRKITKQLHFLETISQSDIQPLIDTTEKLAIRTEILQHENVNLRLTLINEKKCHK